MKSRTGIIVLIVIVVLAIIVIFSLSSGQPASPIQNSTSTTTPDQSTVIPMSNNIVTLTDKGFSPSPITIKSGEAVTFINNSTGQMWVASNPHPTHTDLPGFDEKASATPGQYWTYTFSVVGAHGYHNHANPVMKGQVIVQ